MTKEELKKLEDDLWDSANTLRATGGIKSADYAVPVLGIIFLRFADNKFGLVEEAVNAEFEKHKGTRMEVPIADIAKRLCGLYLSPASRYEYLLHLPNSKSLAQAIKDAMEDIESHQDEQFKEILPKDAYAQIEKNSADILPQLIKTFSDIPSSASGDVFGKIYEYFLGKFALSEGQKGGEFFTPTSVVKFIVEAIEPYKGKIFDPACGSGGMFVQSANFIERSNKERSNIYVCGQEHERSTVKLAKMNLLVNNLSGEIKKANSYEDDCFSSKGKFDFVMANPPFNVKGVKENAVKGDSRFTEYGLPKGKGKKEDKITDANYLWISLFATSLNKKGRAGFVMPNSASDARNAEYDIRKKIVDSNIVDCMVSIPSNMFYTVTLPATLWFFDKQKKEKEHILFIDARNVFTQIDRAHREWSEEQVQNLSSIVRLYRGEKERYLEVVSGYIYNYKKLDEKIDERFTACEVAHNMLLKKLSVYSEATERKGKDALAKSAVLKMISELKESTEIASSKTRLKPSISSGSSSPLSNKQQLEFFESASRDLVFLGSLRTHLEAYSKTLLEILKTAEKSLKAGVKERTELSSLRLLVEVHLLSLQEEMEHMVYWHENIEWLQSRFPNAEYEDVLGLCKVAKREAYVEEQDYSLNAGRYVGIELEEDNLTTDEFKDLILEKHKELMSLNEEALDLEALIDSNIREVF